MDTRFGFRLTAGVVTTSIMVAAMLRTPAAPTAQAQSRAGEPIQDGRIRPSPLAGAREAYLPIALPSSHAANLLQLRNGDLLCVWFSGAWEGDSNVGILLSRLSRGSDTWSRPQIVNQQEGWSFQNPVLFEEPAPSDRLWLFHTRQAAGKGQFSANVLTLQSTDHGRTWSTPSVLFDAPGSYVRQRLIASTAAPAASAPAASGLAASTPVKSAPDASTWLLPVFYTPSYNITTGAEENYSAVKRSTDGGKTWTECEIPGSKGLVHPNIIQRGPRDFVMLFRSRFADWIYRSTSEDGCTWTTPAPTRLPNNNASIQAVRLANGHLVIAFDNAQATTTRVKAQATDRRPLSVALSEDGGRSWPWVRDVEEGEDVRGGHFPERSGKNEYSYPSVLQSADGQLHLAYTYRRSGIKYLTFDEGWIKQGKTIGVFKGD